MSWAMSPQQCHMLQRHVTTALSHQWGVATWWFRSSAVVDQNIFLVLHFSKFLLQLFFSLHLSLYVLSQRLKIQRKFHRQHNRTMIYFNFQKQQTHFYKFAKYYTHIYCQFIFNVRILFTLLFKRFAIRANFCTLFKEIQTSIRFGMAPISCFLRSSKVLNSTNVCSICSYRSLSCFTRPWDLDYK